ncbi:DUF542 domain-containing protein [Ornithinimicrobium avium]|uniref:Iron-sulfur cluster repair di-iron protein n=1 Tax=Ornithinimicrobium avium TaxID=2283195 RepID=A0A345NKI7_9MICO|nr:DUF542 domain-containing protein [Ornithinimicrobium avium]AXH95545.1 iron-sulfur cluster repair di-iron protein [Ornithinimicrobium avium]
MTSTVPTDRSRPVSPGEVTLADLVLADGSRAKVLEKFGLRYCCDGESTLAQASANAGVALEEVSAALNLTAATHVPAAAAAGDLGGLTRQLVDTHHAQMWGALLKTQDLVDTVARVHGWHHPHLRRVRELFSALVADLGPHLIREERVVFPAIAQLEATRRPVDTGQGPLVDLLDELTGEHDVMGAVLGEIQRITHDFATPHDGCVTFREMNEALRTMQTRLHHQLHQENNVLFPAARALAEAVGQ